MLKRIVPTGNQQMALTDPDWIDINRLAEVEVTSEDPDHSIESALLPRGSNGWRAAAPGRQTIRVLFARPQRVRRIRLSFEERAIERSQEYVLRWSPDGGRSYQDIVRQQWNFSPGGAITETEDHRVELGAVTVLELSIVPDINGGTALASLAQLRMA